MNTKGYVFGSGRQPFESTVGELKLDLNERCQRPPAWARQALTELPESAFWSYAGREPLEARIAAKFALQPQRVLVTCGSDEAVALLFSHLPAATPVLLPEPISGVYRRVAELQPVSTHFIPANEDLTLDQDAITKALSTINGGLLVLARPNNPTGELPSDDVVSSWLQLAAQRHTLLLLDECYAEFAEQSWMTRLADHANLIILRTFSKAYGLAGLRVGYLATFAPLLEPLRRFVMPYNVSSVSLHIADRALTASAEAEVSLYVDAVCENRQALFVQLRGMGVQVLPSKANFLLLQLGEKRARFVYQALKGRNILVRRFQRSQLRGCLRISIPTDIRLLEQALTSIFQPRLLCLDVDNTLIDTSTSFDQVVIQVVRHFSGKTLSLEALAATRSEGGFNDDWLLSGELIRRQGVDVPQAEVTELAERLYLGDEQYRGFIHTEKPIIDLNRLQRLGERYRIALVTGRYSKEMGPVLPMLALPNDTFTVTRDKVARGKPHPEGVQKAMKHFDTRAAWMVGDNVDDIEAALRAGAVAIGVGANRDALLAAGAAIVLETINEIEALL